MGIELIVKKNKERIILKQDGRSLGFIEVAERNATVAVALNLNLDKSIIVHREKIKSPEIDDESYYNNERFNK